MELEYIIKGIIVILGLYGLQFAVRAIVGVFNRHKERREESKDW